MQHERASEILQDCQKCIRDFDRGAERLHSFFEILHTKAKALTESAESMAQPERLSQEQIAAS